MLLRRQTIIKNNLNILNKHKDPVIFDALFIGTDEVSKEWLEEKEHQSYKEIIDVCFQNFIMSQRFKVCL